jgi:hypothetical protein
MDFYRKPHSRLEIHPQCLYQPAISTAPTNLGSRYAALAQVVEHIIRNDGVAGSSPASGTIS